MINIKYKSAINIENGIFINEYDIINVFDTHNKEHLDIN